MIKRIYDYTGGEKMDYIIGVTCHVEVQECNPVPILEGMKAFSYPAATWVVINADGELPYAIQDIYKAFYSEWLPNSGYRLADLPVIECYLGEKHQEVWIAVETHR